MSARHLRTAKGSRCGRGKDLTFDDWMVTCGRCRELGPAYEKPPDNAVRTNNWFPAMEVDGGDRGVLNLHNVIFIDGGSLFWFEEPNIFAVMHARQGGTVARYEGTWEPKEVLAL